MFPSDLFTFQIVRFMAKTLAVQKRSCEVESLAELATKISVRHADLLGARVRIIPPVLFHSLLLSSISTNRVLSIRVLLSSWPLDEMCLANCAEFTPEHAAIMAHCFKMGCNKLRRIDLSWCNTGIQGTKLLLKLATGKELPNIYEYGVNSGQSQDVFKTGASIAIPSRLHLQTDCYIDQGNFPMFMDVLNDLAVLDFKVSCLHAVELGPKRIKRLLKKMQHHQAQFLTGLNFEMNGLPSLEDHNLATMSFSSFHITHQQKPSKYCFTAFNSFCHLKYLNLSGNIIGQLVIFMILKNLSDKACLTHLVLNSCSIGPKRQYIDQISNFQCIQKLEHLELANNRLDNVDHMMKLFYKCCNTLFYLNMEMNGFRSDSLPAIQKLLKNPFHLKILSIGKNQLSFNDIQQSNTSFCLVKF